MVVYCQWVLEFRRNFETEQSVSASEATTTGRLFANMIDTLLLAHIQDLRYSNGASQLRLYLPAAVPLRQYVSITNKGGTGQLGNRSDNLKFYQLGPTIDHASLICDYSYSSHTRVVCRYDYDWQSPESELHKLEGEVEEVDVMAASLLRISLGLNGQAIGAEELEHLREVLAHAEVP